MIETNRDVDVLLGARMTTLGYFFTLDPFITLLDTCDDSFLVKKSSFEACVIVQEA